MLSWLGQEDDADAPIPFQFVRCGLSGFSYGVDVEHSTHACAFPLGGSQCPADAVVVLRLVPLDSVR